MMLYVEESGPSPAPVLIVVGEKETFVAKQHARKLVRAIPGARGLLVSTVGHVWNLQAPDLFTDMLRAWITDSPLPPSLQPLIAMPRQ
jgi:pimeloyl-ACP methyl ester carboxylesterase